MRLVPRPLQFWSSGEVGIQALDTSPSPGRHGHSSRSHYHLQSQADRWVQSQATQPQLDGV